MSIRNGKQRLFATEIQTVVQHVLSSAVGRASPSRWQIRSLRQGPQFSS